MKLPSSLENGFMSCSKEFTAIIIFVSKKKSFLLPFYTSVKLFVGEVCRQYKIWARFFHDKRK
jgi:hypothetical protein